MLWYPGHMAKARALVRENAKLVDLILEVVDARVPQSSRNPEVDQLVGQKPRLLVLNKADLANPEATDHWQEWFRDQGLPVVPLESLRGRGIKAVIKLSRQLVEPFMQRLKEKGRKPRSVRLMIVGIPNVGKSSLLNRLAGRKRAATGAKPGITKGKQWVKVDKELELLDTPGILWPRTGDRAVTLRLAATGAIPAGALLLEEASRWLGAFLLERAPQQLVSRYGLCTLPDNPDMLLQAIGARRGFLLPGGVVDREKTARLLLKEFQNGLLGRHTLELPARRGGQ